MPLKHGMAVIVALIWFPIHQSLHYLSNHCLARWIGLSMLVLAAVTLAATNVNLTTRMVLAPNPSSAEPPCMVP